MFDYHLQKYCFFILLYQTNDAYYSIITSPVKGSEILQYNESSFPEMQNLGTLILSLVFCNDSGIILKHTGLLASFCILGGTLSSTMNSNDLLTSFAKKLLFISQRIKYWIFTKTP